MRMAAVSPLPRAPHHPLSGARLPRALRPRADDHALVLVIGKLLGGGPDVWDRMGEMTARDDFTGLYKAMLWKDNPHGMLRNLRELWRIHHDTGRVELERVDERTAILAVFDYA